jgi:hypothetical protein
VQTVNSHEHRVGVVQQSWVGRDGNPRAQVILEETDEEAAATATYSRVMLEEAPADGPTSEEQTRRMD